MIDNSGISNISRPSSVPSYMDTFFVRECKEAVDGRLMHMMEMSRAVAIDISTLASFSHSVTVSTHRKNAIIWIKEVNLLFE